MCVAEKQTKTQWEGEMVKDQIIKILKEYSGQPVSGEKLSQQLKVSRTAIWKQINNLRQEGYTIESIPSKGYILQSTPDLLSTAEIQSRLNTKVLGQKIIHFDSIDSTNNIAKDYALNEWEEGLLITAEEQTSGRGRRGRPWASPKGTGIWMSLLLRPNILPSEAPKFTLLAAVAVAKSIYQETGLLAQIKWPNDIILDKKKVCGILTEMNAELDNINYIIIGIGLNTNQKKEDFPTDIRQQAISLAEVKGERVSRQNLVRRILENLEMYYLNFIQEKDFTSILQEWRELSCTIGRQVKATFNGEEVIGTAVDITDEGALLVQKEDGDIIKISYGDVSIRGIYDYI